MSDRLDKAVSSVDPDSLPGVNEDGDTDRAKPTPDSATGDQGGKGHGEDEGGRTVDNVRGELERKRQQDREYFLGRFSSLEEKIDQLLSNGNPVAAKPTNQPTTLDDMSVADLKRARKDVPEDQLAAFDEYLAERIIDEKVDQKVSARQSKQTYAQQEGEANSEAMSRWQDLRDPTSDIYRMTNKILNQMGPLADNNPRAVLDAANEAGLQLGLSPRTNAGPRVRKVRNTAPGRTNAPAPDDQPSVDQDRLNEVGRRLSGAFKNGKISDEAMERIKERTAQYKANIDKFVR